ncbi:Mediator of RNA polymerase II transcription subunit 6 [Podila minutissima]|uniref:Mediator of RNA polymerase II transcription subunit 6 n=1 Tax=Podila minutissima TaxID=64525 RepID=A0A9P5VM06_9FUNG|nr:Mediator of RNA polymerase II transcription subunit 6 [Podila minutissima]
MAAAGATGGSEAKVDLMNIEWRFQEWLIGMGGLNPENVLDYFALSPFWDPECNNAVLRMQTQFNNLGEMKQRLSEMTGVEFALVLDRYPHLFVIQKQRRKSPQEVKPMAIYYVLHGNIFQCPDLQTVLSNRVLGSLHYVQSAFNEARVMTEFHPSTGYHWKTEEVPIAPGSSTPALLASSSTTSTGAHKTESVDFRNAVERAIISTDKKLRDQKEQTGNLGAGTMTSATAAGSAAAAAGSKVKTEPGTPVSGSSTPGGKGTATTKTAAKRRKKSEDPSTAAANINTSAALTGGRPMGGGPATPATPIAATPTKRRKKTKTMDTK